MVTYEPIEPVGETSKGPCHRACAHPSRPSASSSSSSTMDDMDPLSVASARAWGSRVPLLTRAARTASCGCEI
jgi:hypothetical protein